VVIGSSSTVLATASLHEDTKAEAKLDADPSVMQLAATARLDTNGETRTPMASVGVWDFTVTMPGGLPRYGISVGKHPVLWLSVKQLARGRNCPAAPRS